jgi:hypothetical protein
VGTEGQAEGPEGHLKPPGRPCCGLAAHWELHPWGSAVLTVKAQVPWPAQTYLEVGGSPQDNVCALRHESHGVLTRC